MPAVYPRSDTLDARALFRALPMHCLKVDLFDHTDAIYSIANYLKHHGWRPGISRDKAYKVILRYNYSKYYANTILKISERLHEG